MKSILNKLNKNLTEKIPKLTLIFKIKLIIEHKMSSEKN